MRTLEQNSRLPRLWEGHAWYGRVLAVHLHLVRLFETLASKAPVVHEGGFGSDRSGIVHAAVGRGNPAVGTIQHSCGRRAVFPRRLGSFHHCEVAELLCPLRGERLLGWHDAAKLVGHLSYQKHIGNKFLTDFLCGRGYGKTMKSLCNVNPAFSKL